MRSGGALAGVRLSQGQWRDTIELLWNVVLDVTRGGKADGERESVDEGEQQEARGPRGKQRRRGVSNGKSVHADGVDERKNIVQ